MHGAGGTTATYARLSRPAFVTDNDGSPGSFPATDSEFVSPSWLAAQNRASRFDRSQYW